MSARTKAELFLLSCTVIWGGTFVVVKQGLADASPLFFIALRFSLATILFVLLSARSVRQINKPTLRGGLALGIILFLGFATQTVGLQYTTASKAGFITGLLVVFTPLFQIMIEKRLPKTGNVIGVILVVVGLFLLTSPEGSEFNLGDGLTLICAALFGLYIVFLDMYSKEHDPLQLSFLQFVVTAVLAAVASPLFESIRYSMTLGFMASLAYLTILATVFTLTIQTRYQKDTTPTRAAIIFSVEPVFAAVIAYFSLGERIGSLGILGGIIVVLGLLVSELSDVLFGRKVD